MQTTREKLLGTKFTSKKLTVDLGDGPVDIFVRRPSVTARGAIVELAKTPGAFAKVQTTAVIECVFDAAGNRLFKAEDEAALLELPAGSWIDEVTSEAVKMLGIDQEDAAKK